ncbi:Acyl-CoA-binding protein ACBP [Fasciola gigantica]|uniref:Acyl-CoA-binding protein ACBP n=1 Tax=Fasciola gigantica TaxID=46835 RepID=A0A504ZCM4_FASGI|nr:Acyl-CoA-binding protein ACBP [Fasciola gigantica]
MFCLPSFLFIYSSVTYRAMTTIEEKFAEVAEEVKHLQKRPDNNELLQLYGLYKQATAGDNNTSQPVALRIEAKSKWDSWNSKKGMSKEQAMKEYVEFASSMKTKYGMESQK